LVQIDYDGRFETFDVIRIVRQQEGVSTKVKIYPNPTSSNNINAIISNVVDDSPITITIFGLDGILIHQETLKSELGDMKIAIRPNTELSVGLYQVIIQQGSVQKTSKVMIN